MITLRDGRPIRLAVDRAHALELIVGDEGVHWPYPNAGLGGHKVVVSPRETHAAVWLFSGQSEVGYELFALTPKLMHLGGLPYHFGHSEAPVFSSDNAWLALATTVNGTLDPFDEAPWGVLFWQSLLSSPAPPHRCALEVVSKTDEDQVDALEHDFEPKIQFDHDSLVVLAPWGEKRVVHLGAPLPASLTFEGPTS